MSPDDGYPGHRRGMNRDRDRDRDRERDHDIDRDRADHDRKNGNGRKRPREQNAEPVDDSRAEARPSDGDWVEYAEILDIPVKGFTGKFGASKVVASIVNKVLNVKTNFKDVQLVETADRGSVHARYDLRDCRLFPHATEMGCNMLGELRRGTAFPITMKLVNFTTIKRTLRFVTIRKHTTSASSKRPRSSPSHADRDRRPARSQSKYVLRVTGLPTAYRAVVTCAVTGMIGNAYGVGGQAELVKDTKEFCIVEVAIAKSQWASSRQLQQSPLSAGKRDTLVFKKHGEEWPVDVSVVMMPDKVTSHPTPPPTPDPATNFAAVNELVWDETRPINTIDNVSVTGSSAEGRWVLCDRTIWVPMERAMALPPLGSKMTVRAFYTADAELAGWSSERRKCQWQAVEVLLPLPTS